MSEVNSEKAFEVCKKLKDNIRKMRELQLENIPLFQEILEGEYFKVDMGDENATWSGFLGQPEVLYSRSNVNSWLKVKTVLIDKYGMSVEQLGPIKLSKLVMIAVHARDKDHAEQLLASAATLLPREWKDLENSLRGKVVSDDGHTHDFKHFKQCKLCALKEADEV